MPLLAAKQRESCLGAWAHLCSSPCRNGSWYKQCLYPKSVCVVPWTNWTNGQWFVGIKSVTWWASEMAQWVKLPATKLDHQSLLPGTYTVEGDNQFLQVVL